MQAPPLRRCLLRNVNVEAKIEQLAAESYLAEFIQQSLQHHPLVLLGGELLDFRPDVCIYRWTTIVEANPLGQDL
jgi:hypothetical protein